MAYSARQQAWICLSELFLDTQSDARDTQRIADRLCSLGFDATEARHMLLREVAPVFGANLLSIMGNWRGWPEDEIIARIQRSLDANAASRVRIRLLGWYQRNRVQAILRKDWERIAAAMDRNRPAPASGQGQACRQETGLAMDSFIPRRIDVHVFRYPIANPVRTSFGTMRDRPGVFVRIEDEQGGYGWGEAWCNFSSVGAEHRARLLAEALAPLVIDREFADAPAMFAYLSQATAVLALQTAEAGPFAQTIAALDIAAWDLLARRAGTPLWQLLGGVSGQIGVYASGLNPGDGHLVAAARMAEGHTAFKLKIGFGAETDQASLDRVRAVIGDAPLAVDANQAWDLAQARNALPRLAPFAPTWLEEPLRCDRPWDEWQALAREAPMPLAGGENLLGEAGFDAAFDAGAFGVIQPDIAKWGGFSGCLKVARRFLAGGIRFYPHYLGAGIGLVAAGHLLAAAGGDGRLEVDANDNPLRDLIATPLATLDHGRIDLSQAPGLGIEPDLGRLERYRVRF